MIATEKEEHVHRTVQSLYESKPDWVTFYREVLGLQGVVRQMFPTRESLEEFEKTTTYQEIQQMLTRLREKGPVAPDPQEPTRVITVRLPRSLHEALRIEAHEHHTSMNKLCISKLVQFIDNQMVPTQR